MIYNLTIEIYSNWKWEEKGKGTGPAGAGPPFSKHDNFSVVPYIKKIAPKIWFFRIFEKKIQKVGESSPRCDIICEGEKRKKKNFFPQRKLTNNNFRSIILVSWKGINILEVYILWKLITQTRTSFKSTARCLKREQNALISTSTMIIFSPQCRS